MVYQVTLLPGDGIGPEVTAATVKALEATGVKLRWDVFEVGESALKRHNTPLPEVVLDSIRSNRVGLKGPVTTPVGYGFRSVNVAIRKALSLYACVRPCKNYAGISSLYSGINMVIIRENLEDVYAGVEFEKARPETLKLIEHINALGAGNLPVDSGISIKMISETGSRRVIKFAFDYAKAHGRKRVTLIHKANIMKFTDGLFLAVGREVAKAHPDIEFQDLISDNMNAQLIKCPQQFEVIVAPNLFGDLISDLCAALVGGLGIAPGANFGDDIAVFEATHGSAHDIAGQNKANPMALMLSSAMMLEHLGEKEAAKKLENAVAAVLAEGKCVTADLKTSDGRTAVGTSRVAEEVIARMKSL